MKVSQKIISQLKNKKILILGLAREGISTYYFLRQILPDKELALADKKPLAQLKPKFQQELKQDKKALLFFGEEHLQHLNHFDLIFKTPGIPVNLKPIQQALKNGAQLSSNLQLFLEIIEQHKQRNKQIVKLDNPQPTRQRHQPIYGPLVIGVTGTKGKSTVAALTHHVLKQNKQDSVLVGNIGQPALDKVEQITSKTKLVIEMSSHQLETINKSPDISIIQQITSEHLDYFENHQAYLDAKKSITIYQKVNQYVIYNPEFKYTSQIARLSPGYQLLYRSQPAFDIKVSLKSHCLTFRYRDQQPQKVIKIDQIPLLGKHNLQNVMPVIVAGRLVGLTNDQIAQAIQSFKPLPHRLELVAVKNGVKYVNDSMATMPEAQIAALKAFQDSAIILFAGGHERQQDFSAAAKYILEHKVKGVVLLPPNGERFWQTVLKTAKQFEQKQKLYQLPQKFSVAEIKGSNQEKMNQAIAWATDLAQPGDAIVMSPGAASFGLFDNYADRGEKFRQAVEGLKT